MIQVFKLPSLITVVFLIVFAEPIAAVPLEKNDERPPECGTMVHFGDALGDAFFGMHKILIALGTTLVPHLGYRLAKDSGAITVSWPLQLAFGTVVAEKDRPYSVCRANPKSEKFRAHRILLEPQFIKYTHTDGVATKAAGIRPAYRFVYHAENSKLGYGLGLGGNFSFVERDIESALSSELLIQYGACCSPGFSDFALRHDYNFSRKSHAFSFSFGWSYF